MGENYSGTLNIFSIENKLIKSYTVKNNKVVVTHHTNVAEVGAGTGDGMTLPDVTVTGYVNNVAITLMCLYYAWAGSGVYPNYYNSYTPAYNMNHGGGNSIYNASQIVQIMPAFTFQEVYATIINYPDHKLVTVTDKSLSPISTYFAAVVIIFSVDNNNQLIKGTQNVTYTGIEPELGTWTQASNQNPVQVEGQDNNIVDFNIQGSFTYTVLGISTPTIIYSERVQVNMQTALSSTWGFRGLVQP